MMAKSIGRFPLAIVVLALGNYIASAYDPSPLQDFCVAVNDPKEYLFVNGKFCKNPKEVKAEDFFFSGLNIPGNTENAVGSNVTTVNVENLPGLNTLGISVARLDFAPYGGLNPPHIHPRATELITVIKGTLYVAFVASNQNGNRLFAKVLKEGDVFVFPIGMIHFEINIGKTPALALSGFGSQNAGVITVANAVFGSDPPIDAGVLAKAFMLDKEVVEMIQKKFARSMG